MGEVEAVCNFCVMDTQANPDIRFDKFGQCNYCRDYDEKAAMELHVGIGNNFAFKSVVNELRDSTLPWNCVIGLSGGLDSSYVALKVKELGLRPLVVVIDNDWGTDEAKNNIRVLISELGLNVVRYNVPHEYRDIQLALLKSGTINAEVYTDHLIYFYLYKTAIENKIKYIFHGGNIVTEAIMPECWGYDAKDWKFIKSVHKKHGAPGVDISDFPHMTLRDWFDVTYIKKIKWFPILNYIRYDQSEAKYELKKIGWQGYGYKHMENVYTRWFQGFILPKRWGIDKRKAHFSTLICSGQMTRRKALELLRDPYYPKEQAIEDTHEIRRWFGITPEAMFDLIHGPKRSHRNYRNSELLFKGLKGFVEMSRKVATGN